ncbi:expressed unknown protein [Seminavis robusta]|uniref:Uncharacterized protein n=1 Tax=Seminavis robusta TaxID=568900 RepID=A0A9N8HJT1_9STRA|nr:expressed unknown protein [Seminavis robusta]|eukprot:Sro684_g186770.1 n/a (223) ;mRNA; f:23154-23822
MGATESKVAPSSKPTGKVVIKGKGKNKKAVATAVAKAKVGSAANASADGKEVRVVRPNDYELAIKSCKELEFILETEFGSTGATLHEMITNANASLPIELIMNMRYVATIGNNLVHEKSFSYIPDQDEFVKRYQRSVNALQEISQQRRIVERRVVEAKRKKREAEIQEELMNEDREWLDKQHREVTAQKARKLELEKEKEALEKQRREIEELQAKNRLCACF